MVCWLRLISTDFDGWFRDRSVNVSDRFVAGSAWFAFVSDRFGMISCRFGTVSDRLGIHSERSRMFHSQTHTGLMQELDCGQARG